MKWCICNLNNPSTKGLMQTTTYEDYVKIHLKVFYFICVHIIIYYRKKGAYRNPFTSKLKTIHNNS